MRILASISTKNRYDNYLPMAIMSVANQTRKPNHLTIYDDNEQPKDLRGLEVYNHLFRTLDVNGITWDVTYGVRRGQHYNHQRANMSSYDAVWRLDDDCVAEPDVLEKLEAAMTSGVGAVGGSILNPMMPVSNMPLVASSKIDELSRPNKQWFRIPATEDVDHLHCSFLYRTKIANYDLRLSPKAHREETMYYGVDQTTPFRTASLGSGSTTPASLTPTSSVGDTVLDTLCVNKAATISAPGAGQNQRYLSDIGAGGNNQQATHAGSDKDGAASTTTMTWTITTGNEWAMIAAAMIPAPAVLSFVPWIGDIE